MHHLEKQVLTEENMVDMHSFPDFAIFLDEFLSPVCFFVREMGIILTRRVVA